jgi:hypothetical protein
VTPALEQEQDARMHPGPIVAATRRTTLAAGLAALAPGCSRRTIGSALPAPALRRGVNIHHMLNWPAHRNGQPTADYVWPPFATARYQLADKTLEEIVAHGFTFVRLTVDPAILIAADPARRAELSSLVMSRVDRFLAAGLEVLVDLHPVRENPAYPPEALTAERSPQAGAYAAVVATLARDLSQRPLRQVALELMNEPHPADRAGAERWRKQQAGLYAAARRSAPDLALVLSGADWGSAHELTRLDLAPYAGGNVILAFHYYSPRLVTLAGMPTALPERYVQDLAWPPNQAQVRQATQSTVARIAADPRLSREEKASVTAKALKALDRYASGTEGEARVDHDFRAVADWAAAHGVPAARVLVGEFGAYRRADETPAARAVRLTWLEAVRRAAEMRGFGWAIWVLQGDEQNGGGFGVLRQGQVTGLDAGVIRALGLRDH